MNPGSPRAMANPVSNINDTVLEPTAPSSNVSNVNDTVLEPTAPGSNVNDDAQAQDLFDVGWCRIVEEPPNA